MSIIACLLTAFTLAAGSAAAYAQSDLSSLVNNAKQEKEVVWYTTTSAGDNQAIVAGFTKKYPFLKVQVLRSTGEKLRQRSFDRDLSRPIFLGCVEREQHGNGPVEIEKPAPAL